MTASAPAVLIHAHYPPAPGDPMTDQASNATARSVRLVNDPAAIRDLQNSLVADAELAGHGRSTAFALRLALEEAVRNALVHGCTGRADLPIDVAWSVSPDLVTITVEDPGPGFDPYAVPDPTTDENLEAPSGRGLLLMRAYMTSVEYNDRGNRVTMRYEPGAD